MALWFLYLKLVIETWDKVSPGHHKTLYQHRYQTLKNKTANVFRVFTTPKVNVGFSVNIKWFIQPKIMILIVIQYWGKGETAMWYDNFD